MEQKICQSCGMPMMTPEEFGTNNDGSINHNYCTHCFKDGNFVSQLTMEEMIDHCVKYVEDFNSDSGSNLTKEQAIELMKQTFPTLKRWQK